MIRTVRELLCAMLLFVAVSPGRAGDKPDDPLPAGAGAKVIQPPGVLRYQPGGVVIATDNCPDFEIPQLPFRPAHEHLRVYRAVPNWDKAVAHLGGHPDNSIRDLYLCSHGTYQGGVSTAKGPDLVVDTLTDDHVKALKGKLVADATVILIGCKCACSDKVLELAKRLDRRIVANTGNIGLPGDGKGNWVVFTPHEKSPAREYDAKTFLIRNPDTGNVSMLMNGTRRQLTPEAHGQMKNPHAQNIAAALSNEIPAGPLYWPDGMVIRNSETGNISMMAGGTRQQMSPETYRRIGTPRASNIPACYFNDIPAGPQYQPPPAPAREPRLGSGFAER